MKSVTSSFGLASIKEQRSENIGAEGRSQKHSLGLVAAIAANVIWGASFIASKYTLVAWGPITASALRFGLATIILIAAAMLTGKRISKPKGISQWSLVAAVATIGFGLLYPLQLSGLQTISSGLSAGIMLLSPLIVILLGRVFLREGLSTRKLVAIALGVAGGLVLLSSTGALQLSIADVSSSGTVFTLGAAACLALAAILTKRLSRGMNSTSITVWTLGIGFFELAVAAITFEGQPLNNVFLAPSLQSWVSLLFLAGICSALCFFLWNFALAENSPREIASTMHIKTPTAVMLGVLLANEGITFVQVIATVTIGIAVYLSQTESARRTYQ